MRKTDEPFELEELLKAVEHAGRDNRRQQQLSELIDKLASDEAATNRKKVWRRWSIAISAAACLLIFVTTLVRLSTPNTNQPSGTLLASTGTDTIDRKLVQSVDSLDNVDTQSQRQPWSKAGYMLKRSTHSQNGSLLAENISEEPVEPERIVAEPEIDNDTTINFFDNDIQYAEQIQIHGSDEMIQASEHIDTTTPNVSVDNTVTHVDNRGYDQKRSRRWFSLRRAEPSKMDGTMLALRIM